MDGDELVGYALGEFRQAAALLAVAGATEPAN
jgi:hypothetical protein